MLDLNDSNYHFISTARGKANPLGEASAEKTILPANEATTRAVLESYDFLISCLKGMTPAQLREKVSLQGCEVIKFVAFAKVLNTRPITTGKQPFICS